MAFFPLKSLWLERVSSKTSTLRNRKSFLYFDIQGVHLLSLRIFRLESRMRSVSFLWLLLLPSPILSAVRKPKAKFTKPYKSIDWKSSYYSEPFEMCKTMKNFNPIEQAKAHGAAVDVFRKCGPSLIIPYATKYNYPAYGKTLLTWSKHRNIVARREVGGDASKFMNVDTLFQTSAYTRPVSAFSAQPFLCTWFVNVVFRFSLLSDTEGCELGVSCMQHRNGLLRYLRRSHQKLRFWCERNPEIRQILLHGHGTRERFDDSEARKREVPHPVGDVSRLHLRSLWMRNYKNWDEGRWIL